jgi:hypothetical protein
MKQVLFDVKQLLFTLNFRFLFMYGLLQSIVSLDQEEESDLYIQAMESTLFGLTTKTRENWLVNWQRRTSYLVASVLSRYLLAKSIPQTLS